MERRWRRRRKRKKGVRRRRVEKGGGGDRHENQNNICPESGVVLYSCNPSTWEKMAGGSGIH